MASEERDTYGGGENTARRSSFALEALETPKTIPEVGNDEELAQKYHL